VPDAMMKTYLKHNCNIHSNFSLCTDWSNEADLKDSEYFISKDFDSDYAELMNVLYYNSESHSQRLSMVRMDGVKEIHSTE
jgi:hypothetical protein